MPGCRLLQPARHLFPFNLKLYFMNKKFIAFLLLAALQSCTHLNQIPSVPLPDPTEIGAKTEQLIQTAIATIQEESGNWRTALRDLANQLTESAQSTIRTEVNNLLTRAQATAGAEAKCFVDFMRGRLIQELQRLIAVVRNAHPPLLAPVFCSPVPASIDMSLPAGRRNKIELFGYDFDRYARLGTNVKAVLVKAGGRQEDVTTHLSQQSHYLMTVNLGGNGIVLNEQARKIQLKTGSDDVVAEIPVIQQTVEACAVVNQDLFPLSSRIEIVPLKKGSGDADFGGSARITCSVRLKVTADKKEVEATFKMEAKEYGTQFNDHTKAEGERTTVLYRCPDGFVIEKILSETGYENTYTDKDWNMDTFSVGGNNAVDYLNIYGDHLGADIGDYTKAQFTMKKIRVQLKQSGRCR